MDALKSATPFRLNRAREVKKSEMPIEKLLRLDRPAAPARLSVLRRVPSRECGSRRWRCNRRRGCGSLRGCSVHAAPTRRSLSSWRRPDGRIVRWHEGEMYQNLALKGYTVAVADLRGIGDMSPEYPRGAAARAIPSEPKKISPGAR